ncbi:hypothetical protein LP421_07835 [Rhizobium sp. RCAM05350]|nr:hypothetical protein LP421_07835 [Rhizobium sp. RCAM05350]
MMTEPTLDQLLMDGLVYGGLIYGQGTARPLEIVNGIPDRRPQPTGNVRASLPHRQG